MVQIIERENAFGKLAQEFGKSFGDVAGEGLQRQAIGSGVSRLADQLAQSGTFDRTKLISGLSRIPGMTPELMGMYYPALENSLRLNALEKKYGPGAAQEAADQAPSAPWIVKQEDSTDEEEQEPIGQDYVPIEPGTERRRGIKPTELDAREAIRQEMGLSPFEQIAPEAVREKLSSLTTEWQKGVKASPEQQAWVQERLSFQEGVPGVLTKEEEALLRRTPTVLTPEQRDRAALQAYRQNPGRFASLNEAYDYVEQQVNASNQQLATEQDRIGRLRTLDQEARSKIDSRLTEVLQAQDLGDTWSDMPASLQQRLKQQALSDLREGASTDEVAQKAANQAIEFARSYKDFKEIPQSRVGSNPGEQILERLGNYRDMFQQYGALPEYVDLLQSKGIRPHDAAVLGYGVSPDVGDYLAKIPSPQRLGFSDSEKGLSEASKINVPRFSEQLAATISAGDSLDAIALDLASKGYDAKLFYNAMDELRSQGRFDPSPHQERELRRKATIKGSTPAALWKVMTGPELNVWF